MMAEEVLKMHPKSPKSPLKWLLMGRILLNLPQASQRSQRIENDSLQICKTIVANDWTEGHLESGHGLKIVSRSEYKRPDFFEEGQVEGQN